MNTSKLLLLTVVALPGFWILTSVRTADALGAAAVTPDIQSGRLVSSSCLQCHSGLGFEGISGESPSEIVSELSEMRARSVPRGIMDLVARGLTDAQIQDVAAYLATLPQSSNED